MYTQMRCCADVSFFGLVATLARNACVEDKGPETSESRRELMRIAGIRDASYPLAIELHTMSTLSGCANISLESRY